MKKGFAADRVGEWAEKRQEEKNGDEKYIKMLFAASLTTGEVESLLGREYA